VDFKIELLEKENLKTVPWKNGLGLTSEIAIFPKAADFHDGDFEWRVSCAQVSAPNRFSQFIGYDRALTIVRGDGLILNGENLLPRAVQYFSGSDKVDCQMIGSPVLDLGIIYKKGEYTVELQHDFHRTLNRAGHKEAEVEIKVAQGHHYFYVVRGRGSLLLDKNFSEGDVLCAKGPVTFTIRTQDAEIHLIRASIMDTGSSV